MKGWMSWMEYLKHKIKIDSNGIAFFNGRTHTAHRTKQNILIWWLCGYPHPPLPLASSTYISCVHLCICLFLDRLCQWFFGSLYLSQICNFYSSMKCKHFCNLFIFAIEMVCTNAVRMSVSAVAIDIDRDIHGIFRQINIIIVVHRRKICIWI